MTRSPLFSLFFPAVFLSAFLFYIASCKNAERTTDKQEFEGALSADIPVFPKAVKTSEQSALDGPPQGEADRVVTTAVFHVRAPAAEVESFYSRRAGKSGWVAVEGGKKAVATPDGFAQGESAEVVLFDPEAGKSGLTRFALIQSRFVGRGERETSGAEAGPPRAKDGATPAQTRSDR